jgi:hypothetical protein
MAMAATSRNAPLTSRYFDTAHIWYILSVKLCYGDGYLCIES